MMGGRKERGGVSVARGLHYRRHDPQGQKQDAAELPLPDPRNEIAAGYNYSPCTRTKQPPEGEHDQSAAAKRYVP